MSKKYKAPEHLEDMGARCSVSSLEKGNRVWTLHPSQKENK